MSNVGDEWNEGDDEVSDQSIVYDDTPSVSPTARRMTLDLAAASQDATPQCMSFGSPLMQATRGFFSFKTQDEPAPEPQQP